jgi:serine/arginine repetitive matrix protein 2
MKVRFDTATSDSAISDADTGAKKDGKPDDPLPVADWDATSLSRQGIDTSESMSGPSFSDVKSSSPATAPPISVGGDGQGEGDSAANAPPDTTGTPSAGSPPRRKPRRPPSVRLVDEYGHAKVDLPITPSRKDVREHSASMRMPGGGSLKTPRSTSVRMVDAMGHEVDEPSEQNDSEDTVTEVRYSRQEALQRMKRAVADLQEGLNSVDTWVVPCCFLGVCWAANLFQFPPQLR